MSDEAISRFSVRLQETPGGFRIIHGRYVLKVVEDARPGPQRSPECLSEAAVWYERLAGLYQHLYRVPGKPISALQLAALAAIIRQDCRQTKPFSRITLYSLAHKGVIRQNPDVTDKFYSNRPQGWLPNYRFCPHGEPQVRKPELAR